MWSRVALAWSRLLLAWSRRRWPRTPLWSSRTVVNVAGSALALLVAAGALLFALLTDKGHSSHTASTSGPLPSGLTGAAARSSTPATQATPGLTTSTTGTVGAALSEQDARQAIVAYLNAVNARNKIQAGALICQSLLPTWLQNVDSPNSDFSYTITRADFVAATPQGGGTLSVHYTLVFNDKTSNDVDFTVINESGPKICGEQRA